LPVHREAFYGAESRAKERAAFGAFRLSVGLGRGRHKIRSALPSLQSEYSQPDRL